MTLATPGTASPFVGEAAEYAQYEAVLTTTAAPVSLSVSFSLVHRRSAETESIAPDSGDEEHAVIAHFRLASGGFGEVDGNEHVVLRQGDSKSLVDL
ncbi:hypothetical protein ACFY3M_14950 [Streptomyces mirabilis]|uniref:hypothetical protein n=1 Tax=Streptomyces mirabilis TaxID=68239 RepID=UPI003693F111